MLTRLLFIGLIAAAPLPARADGALVVQRATSCTGINATAGAICYDETTGEASVGGVNVHALPTTVQLWSWLASTTSTTEGNVQSFASTAAADTTTGASTGKWIAGFAGAMKRFCVTVATPAPTTTEGCRIYLAKSGSEVSGSTVDFGSDVLDALTETACRTISGTFTATDYFQVVFGAETGATGDYCVDNAACECTGSSLAVRTSLWVTD